MTEIVESPPEVQAGPTGFPNRNTLWAAIFMDELARSGVRELCLAPGSRSAPLVLAAAADARIRIFVHLDERSAAYFALGIGKRTGRPAAVLTTSGTAAANLHPAVIEAAQSETPLLLLTADRPPRLRHADANQAIDQVRLFGSYPSEFFDLTVPVAEEAALRHLRTQASRAVSAAVGLPGGAVHVNIPFEKPLEPVRVEGDVPEGLGRDHPLATAGRPGRQPWTVVGPRRATPSYEELGALAELMGGARKGIIVAGPNPEPARLGPALSRLSAATGFPVLADPLSGARYRPHHGAAVLGGYDLFLRDPEVRAALAPDVVLRFGQTPTSAAVAAWLEDHVGAYQIVVDPGHRWKDHTATATHYIRSDPTVLAASLEGEVQHQGAGDWRSLWRDLEEAALAVASVESEQTFFEGSILSEVLQSLPEAASLFVSSSMPIRDLDMFGAPREHRIDVFGNRGASGIDGIVSTALGVAVGHPGPTVAILGDIAFYHDMNGLLATREDDADVVFLVINNDGGGIFHMLPVRAWEPAFTPYFATPHGLDFRHVAALYGLPYHRAGGREGVRHALEQAMVQGGSHVIEVLSDRHENERRHRDVVQAVAVAARRVLEG